MRSWTDVENNIVSVERVNEYADTAKEVSNPKRTNNITKLKPSLSTATEFILALISTYAVIVPFRPAGLSRAALCRWIGPRKELCSSRTTGCSTAKALSWR